ncbi:hypothetical protein [Nocardioides sp.]|uniref:hypothetical protein n=1 Tax=Nocardioides sp. TaxID=35761 RepID=UPI0027165DBB|nr:hypothetical protein [Nocardioides sp.]MDO9455211.1 hypothetical protein [Nocardioides sp.]
MRFYKEDSNGRYVPADWATGAGIHFKCHLTRALIALDDDNENWLDETASHLKAARRIVAHAVASSDPTRLTGLIETTLAEIEQNVDRKRAYLRDNASTLPPGPKATGRAYGQPPPHRYPTPTDQPITKPRHRPTETSEQTKGSPMTTAPPADQFGTHMPEYQRGRAWYRHLIESTLVHISNRPDLANRAFDNVEDVIAPLIEWNEDQLRDFIAGVTRELEDLIYPNGR